MNCQRSMNCPRCGSTMIFKKFFDYGGHSWGWECISCKEIIDQTQEIHPSPQEDWNEKEKLRMGKGI
jgi:tRNA(Ile2) C34 agmatinyltransferase TiaS